MGMNVLDTILAQKSPDGKDFERLCKWILLNFPEYKTKFRKVWLWNEWNGPGRWGPDTGIDLVARDAQGKLWAIQAKHYQEKYSISKKALDSWMSASGTPIFDGLLLMATTNRVSSNAEGTMKRFMKPVLRLMRSDLLAAQVHWPTDLADLRQPPPKRVHPKPHQQEAIDAVVNGFKTDDKGKLIMACGTGKTLTGLWIADKLGAKRICVLVPSLMLVEQTVKAWTAQSQGYEYIAVCSDESVIDDDDDTIFYHVTELGIPVTSDTVLIADYMQDDEIEKLVIVSTYQSADLVGQVTQADPVNLLICDEAHRATGMKQGMFTKHHDPQHLRAEKRLFMTATERVITHAQAKSVTYSMDDPQTFGKTFHELTFGEAIDRKLLTDYEVAIPVVSDQDIRAHAIQGTYLTDGRKVRDGRTLGAAITLLQQIDQNNLRKVITFHTKVSAALKFSTRLPEVAQDMGIQPPVCFHIHGKMSAGTRNTILKDFRVCPDRAVLTNARCLQEGVDVPAIDGIAFIDPRRSQVDIAQAVGRALRTSPGKVKGTIIIPAYIEDPHKWRDELESGSFRYVYQILQKIGLFDKSIVEEANEIRRQLGARIVSNRAPSKVKMIVPESMPTGFFQGFAQMLIKKTTLDWWARLGELQAHLGVAA